MTCTPGKTCLVSLLQAGKNGCVGGLGGRLCCLVVAISSAELRQVCNLAIKDRSGLVACVLRLY